MKKVKVTNLSRRQFVLNVAQAGGFLGLKSLLLGLPPVFLTRKVFAAESAQFLVFSENQAGDPVNCNVPGSYVSGVWRVSDPEFVSPPNYLFGTQSHQAAVPWGRLDSDLRARLNFFHLRTKSSAHPESRHVLSIFGSVVGEKGSGTEMIPSAVAQELASSLGTIQKQPICISGLLSYNGLDLPVNRPDRLKSMFSGNVTEKAKNMMAFRDQQLDLIYADLKTNGTPAQRRYLNDFVLSRSQAKNLGESLLDYLNEVTGNTETDHVRTAAALIALKATPVVRIALDFGGDNHFDTDLADEMRETRSGTGNINLLWRELKKYNMHNQTSFAMLNVFGRSLENRGGGRAHNADHNVMVSFGPNIQGGVIGGLDAQRKAAGINSIDGSMTNPDINPDETHHSAVKSLFKALSISDERISVRLPNGKVVQSFIKA